MAYQVAEKEAKLIGNILVESGLVTVAEIEKALQAKVGQRKRLGEILIDSGRITEEQFATALARQLRLPLIDPLAESPEKSALKLFPVTFAQKHVCIPIRIEDDALVVAMSDPLNLIALEDLRHSTGKTVVPAIALKSQILSAIARHYTPSTISGPTVEALEMLAGVAVDSLIAAASDTTTYCIMSNKQGSGRTQLALNLATHLAQSKRVLLIDLDTEHPDLGAKLGLFPERSLIDLLTRRVEAEDVVASTAFGFHVVPGMPGRLTLANVEYTMKLQFLINASRIFPKYDVVIFDSGDGIPRNLLDIAVASDVVIVVTSPLDIVMGYGCIKAYFNRFVELETGFSEKAEDHQTRKLCRPLVVVNQVSEAGQGEREFAKITLASHRHVPPSDGDFQLKVEYLGEVLTNRELFAEMERRRLPFMKFSPESAPTKNFAELADRLLKAAPFEQDRPTRIRRFAQAILQK